MPRTRHGLIGRAAVPILEASVMILILDHRNDDQRPIAPRLLGPEPPRRKCSTRLCMQRLGVYVPARTAAPATRGIESAGSQPK